MADGGPEFDTAALRADLLNGVAMSSVKAAEIVVAAYRAARMARFEHGESGAPQELFDGVVSAPRQVRRRRATPLSQSLVPEELSHTHPQGVVEPTPKRRTPKPRKVAGPLDTSIGLPQPSLRS